MYGAKSEYCSGFGNKFIATNLKYNFPVNFAISENSVYKTVCHLNFL